MGNLYENKSIEPYSIVSDAQKEVAIIKRTKKKKKKKKS